MNHQNGNHHFDVWFRNSEYYMEHAHCVLYDPIIIFLDFWGNIMVGTAYLLIPTLLLRLIIDMWRTMAGPMKGLIVHGAVFVLLCGITHFIHAWNWHHTSYELQSILEILTGLVSMWFAIRLFFFIRWRRWKVKVG